MHKHDYRTDERFVGLEPLKKRALLSSPTIHDEDKKYVNEVFKNGWMTTVGENINRLEELVAEKVGVKYAVALINGTSAIHLAIKLAAERLYGSSSGISTPNGLGVGGSLKGVRVFCTDMTFDATVNPIVYEGGEPVFIDSEYETWNMDPKALRRAFELYPEVKIVVMAHLYGTPGKIKEIKDICREHKAILIEDAAESFGATVNSCQTGSFGDYGIISFNGNKIITGSSGGMLFVNDEYSANKARKWSTQSREAASWYEHEELGYNYRISNLVAGVIRGQMKYLDEHIAAKKKIYECYKKGFADLPVKMNPIGTDSIPNYWLSCLTIDKTAMCETERSGRSAIFVQESGKSCPTEILEALTAFNAEGRPIWKPMHLQPIYRNHGFVMKYGNGRGNSNAYIDNTYESDVGMDIFNRGLCLPSDNKMNEEQQEMVIKIVHQCFE